MLIISSVSPQEDNAPIRTEPDGERAPQADASNGMIDGRVDGAIPHGGHRARPYLFPDRPGLGRQGALRRRSGDMVMTGKKPENDDPTTVMTARDVVEYHTTNKMSVGRGDATVTTNDGKRIRADILVAFGKPDTPEASRYETTTQQMDNPERKPAGLTAPMRGAMSSSAPRRKQRPGTVASMFSIRNWRG